MANSYKNITTNTTTVVKAAPGELFSITINSKGATSNIAQVYDNTSATGSPIATIDTTAQIGTLTYNVAMLTGITIVTSAGTAADITVAYA